MEEGYPDYEESTRRANKGKSHTDEEDYTKTTIEGQGMNHYSGLPTTATKGTSGTERGLVRATGAFRRRHISHLHDSALV
jgi:hypothetical protein